MKKVILVLLTAFSYIFATTDMLGRALPDESKVKALEAISQKAEKGEKINENELRELIEYFQQYEKEMKNKRISDAEIIHFYKSIVDTSLPNAQVKIRSRQYLGNTQYEKVVVSIEMRGEAIEDVVFVHNQYLLPDIIDIPREKSLKEDEKQEIAKIRQNVFEDRVLQAFKNEKKVVSLGTSKNGKELIVFSDPECPYCRQHLDNIDEKFLKNNKINFIFVSVHGKSAFEKIALIWKETNKIKDDNQKLRIIKKYYQDDVKYTAPNANAVKEAEILLSKYMTMGLRQVPYIIEVDKKDKK